MLAGWLIVFLVTSVTADTTVYGMLGGEVNLKPEGVSVTSETKSITWKNGVDIALEWDNNNFEVYRYYKGRVSLNTSTGVMTIKGLVHEDRNMYTPEIGAKVGAPVHLIVISSVPEPTIGIFQTNSEKREFRLTCDGDTTGAKPVSYSWKADNNVLEGSSEKHCNVTEASSGVKEFSCEMKNPVSQRSSLPIQNPIKNDSGPKISTGITVFVCLLAATLLLVIFHRVKSGVWFYEKSFMPWEGGFWRKSDRQQVETTEFNGTSTSQQKGNSDEEAATMEN